MEWNRSLYSDIRTQAKKYRIPISDEQQTRMQNVANATDIWGKVGAVLREKEVEIENNCVWFAHPIYFVNHLKRAGLLDFNPYEGKVLRPRSATGHDYKKIEVKSCPGFAPVYKEGTYEFDEDSNKLLTPTALAERFPFSELQDDTNSNYCWAALNDPFGESDSYGNHTGIDFASITYSEEQACSPIVSMITGKVWAVTWSGSMMYNGYGKMENGKPVKGTGRVMIVKDVNSDLLYLLGHLFSCEKAEGAYVYPGEVVAYVGSTGNSSGEHLHLEVFECDADPETGRGSVLDPNIYKNKPHGFVAKKSDDTDDEVNQLQCTGLTWFGKFNHTTKRINPLDHSEK